MRKSAKYRVGEYVLIDKMFGVNESSFGTMERLEKERIAEVLKVSNTSSGYSYKLKVLGAPDLYFRACFWEEEILRHFDV